MFYKIPVSFHKDYVRFNDDYIKIGIMVKPVNGKTNLKMMKKIAKHLRYQNLT